MTASMILLAFGVVVSMSGIALFARRHDAVANKIELFGIKAELSHASLVIFIVGAAVAVVGAKGLPSSSGSSATLPDSTSRSHGAADGPSQSGAPAGEAPAIAQPARTKSQLSLAYSVELKQAAVAHCSFRAQWLTAIDIASVIDGSAKPRASTRCTNYIVGSNGDADRSSGFRVELQPGRYLISAFSKRQNPPVDTSVAWVPIPYRILRTTPNLFLRIGFQDGGSGTDYQDAVLVIGRK